MEEPIVEIAPGATWKTPESVLSWIDITDKVDRERSAVTTKRGRDSERDQMAPGTARLVFMNHDGWFDPSRQLPPFIATYLNLTGASGSYASTPDVAALDIVGDIDIRVRVSMDDWTPSGNQALIAKWDQASGNQRAWFLRVDATTGTLSYSWSTDGAIGTVLTKTSTAAPTATAGEALWVRVTHDVNNGAAGNDVRFYTSTDSTGDHSLVSWTQLGSTVTTAGVTSIFNSSAAASVGGRIDAAANLAGKVYAAAILNGIGGTVVAAPVFARDVAPGATSFTDAGGRPWTINSPASILFDRTLITPGMPLRIRTATQPVLRGFIGGFPQTYGPGNTHSWVPVSVVDGFGRLARPRLRRSPLEIVIDELGPARWYPLSDLPGSRTLVDWGHTPVQATADDELELGATSLDLPGTSVRFASSRGATLYEMLRTGDGPPYGATVVFVVQTSAAGGTLYDGGYSQGTFLRFGNQATSGQLSMVLETMVASTTQPINDGAAHLVSMTFEVDAGFAYVTSTFVDNIQSSAAGVTGAVISDFYGHPRLGSNDVHLAHFTYWDHAITPAQQLELYEAWRRWQGDTADDRIDRFLDSAGWPTALRDLEPGDATIGAPATDKVVLAAIQDVERTEQGRFFIARDGKARLLNRYWNVVGSSTGTTSQATFGDALPVIPVADIEFDWDDSLVFGAAEGSRVGGETIRVALPNALDEDAVDTGLNDLQLVSDDQVRNLLRYRLDRYGTPVLRVRPIVVHLHALSDAHAAQVLGLELGDRVTVEHTTPAGVDIGPFLAVVESLEHRIASHLEWDVTIGLSPADIRTFAVWGSSLWGDASSRWGY